MLTELVVIPIMGAAISAMVSTRNAIKNVATLTTLLNLAVAIRLWLVFDRLELKFQKTIFFN